jgi:hypothetical protein
MNEKPTDKYAILDAEILREIRRGNGQFSDMLAPLRYIALEHAKPDRWNRKDGPRVIDRRLQALRKKGVITYSRKDGWSTAE